MRQNQLAKRGAASMVLMVVTAAQGMDGLSRRGGEGGGRKRGGEGGKGGGREGGRKRGGEEEGGGGGGGGGEEERMRVPRVVTRGYKGIHVLLSLYM